MNRESFFSFIEDSMNQGLEIIKKKNQDYAQGEDPFRNFRNCEAIGVPLARGILVRMMDKMSRIGNLLDNEAAVEDEKIDDTLLDLANYAHILRAYTANESKYKSFSDNK
jgi:hypothetical protein